MYILDEITKKQAKILNTDTGAYTVVAETELNKTDLGVSVLGVAPYYSETGEFGFNALNPFYVSYPISALIYTYNNTNGAHADVGYPAKTGVSLTTNNVIPELQRIHKGCKLSNRNIAKYNLSIDIIANKIPGKIGILGDVHFYDGTLLNGFKYFPQCIKYLNTASPVIECLQVSDSWKDTKVCPMSLQEFYNYYRSFMNQTYPILLEQLHYWCGNAGIPQENIEFFIKNKFVLTPINEREGKLYITLLREKEIQEVSIPTTSVHNSTEFRNKMLYGGGAAKELNIEDDVLKGCLFNLQDACTKSKYRFYPKCPLVIPAGVRKLTRYSVTLLAEKNIYFEGKLTLKIPNSVTEIHPEFIFKNNKLIKNIMIDMSALSEDLQIALLTYSYRYMLNVKANYQTLLDADDFKLLHYILFEFKYVKQTYGGNTRVSPYFLNRANNPKKLFMVLDKILQYYSNNYENIEKVVYKNEKIIFDRIEPIRQELYATCNRGRFKINQTYDGTPFNKDRYTATDLLNKLCVTYLIQDMSKDRLTHPDKIAWYYSLFNLATNGNIANNPFLIVSRKEDGKKAISTLETFILCLNVCGIDETQIYESFTYKAYKNYVKNIVDFYNSELYYKLREYIFEGIWDGDLSEITYIM